MDWDPTDLSVVHRQYRVFDGTKLDYALKNSGKPTLFVEVKGLNQSLQQPAFIAQTVNYANNEGVLWCVLTNGLTYRVYKTNEPVGMSDKLMLEVDLAASAADEPSTAAALSSLSLLSRDSVTKGHLDSMADAVFLGGRVRTAIETLLIHPTAKFRSLVEGSLGESIERERLDRVLGQFSLVQTALPAVPKSSLSVTPEKASTKSVHGRERHTAGKPMAIVNLFDQLYERVATLGNVSVTYTKFYVNFSTPKQSFMTAQLFKDKMRVHFSIPWDLAPKPKPEAMRDVTKIGHYGLGPTEFVLSSPEQLEAIVVLATASYDRNRP